MGAETLSKLTNLDAVKQQLWGLQLTAKAASGDLILGGSPRVKNVMLTFNGFRTFTGTYLCALLALLTLYPVAEAFMSNC